MKECRIIIINEETGDLLKNELIEEDLADQISGIVEDGFVDNYEECETICSTVTSMLDNIGIATEDHDEMISELEDLKLVKKENGNGKVKKKVLKLVKKEEK